METFVVRVWVPADVEAEGPPAGLHGVVEHLPSKRGRTFRGEADLVAFIHACLPGRSPRPARDGMAIPDPGTDARDAPSVRGIPGAGAAPSPDRDPSPAQGQALGPPAT